MRVLLLLCCCVSRAFHEVELADAHAQFARRQAAELEAALRAVKAASVSAVKMAQLLVRDIDTIPSLPTRLTTLTSAEGEIRGHINALLRPDIRDLFESSNSWKAEVSSVQQALRSVLAAKERVTTMIDAACGQQANAMLGASRVVSGQSALVSKVRDALSPSAAVDIHLMSVEVLAETKMNSSNTVGKVIQQQEAPLLQLRDELMEIPRCGAITKYDQLVRRVVKVVKGARALVRLPVDSFSGREPTHQLNHRLLELYQDLLEEIIRAQERHKSFFPSEEQFQRDKTTVTSVMKEVAAKLNALRAGVEGAQVAPDSEGHEDVQAPLLRNGDSEAALELE